MLFAKWNNFTLPMAPFANRSHGHAWLTRKYPAIGEQEAGSKKVWEALLTLKLLSTKLGTSKENVKILCYQPSLMSHNLELAKLFPSPSLIARVNSIFALSTIHRMNTFNVLLDMLLIVLYSHPFLFNQPSIAPENSKLGGELTTQNNFLRLQHCINI